VSHLRLCIAPRPRLAPSGLFSESFVNDLNLAVGEGGDLLPTAGQARIESAVARHRAAPEAVILVWDWSQVPLAPAGL
jgi:hypothetical protein